jgi:hypothetical protein
VIDLHRSRAESICHLDTLPGNDGLGLFPTQVPDGRGGERNALVDINTFDGRFDSLDLSALDFQDGIGGAASRQCGGQDDGRKNGFSAHNVK